MDYWRGGGGGGGGGWSKGMLTPLYVICPLVFNSEYDIANGINIF